MYEYLITFVNTQKAIKPITKLSSP